MNMESQYPKSESPSNAAEAAGATARARRPGTVSCATCSSANVAAPAVGGRRSADRGRVPVGGRQVPCSLALAAALCACGSSRAPDQSVAPDGGAIYGLDARPSNTTCLAPSRPPAAIDLWRALGGRSFSWPLLVLQAPADASRFFVVQKGGIVSAVSPDGARTGPSREVAGPAADEGARPVPDATSRQPRGGPGERGRADELDRRALVVPVSSEARSARSRPALAGGTGSGSSVTGRGLVKYRGVRPGCRGSPSSPSLPRRIAPSRLRPVRRRRVRRAAVARRPPPAHLRDLGALRQPRLGRRTSAHGPAEAPRRHRGALARGHLGTGGARGAAAVRGRLR